MSDDCLTDLATLCRNLKSGLETRFNEIVDQNVCEMSKIFGVWFVFIRYGELWELSGNYEFREFFKHVYHLQNVRELVSLSATLNFLPHCCNLVYQNLNSTLRAMVWPGPV
jgi:hypothetical protein